MKSDFPCNLVCENDLNLLPTDLDPNDPPRFCINGKPVSNEFANRFNAFLNKRRFLEVEDD